MKKSDYYYYYYYFSKGTEIFHRLQISYYYHSLYAVIYNIYPINYKTYNSKRVESLRFIIKNISNHIKYLNASKFKT